MLLSAYRGIGKVNMSKSKLDLLLKFNVTLRNSLLKWTNIGQS